jgi:hypothetical protein
LNEGSIDGSTVLGSVEGEAEVESTVGPRLLGAPVGLKLGANTIVSLINSRQPKITTKIVPTNRKKLITRFENLKNVSSLTSKRKNIPNPAVVGSSVGNAVGPSVEGANVTPSAIFLRHAKIEL